MININEITSKKDSQKLKRSFMKECSNSEFYNYVTSLGIEEDILIKYTSTLKDSFLEYCNCSKCKSIVNCKNKIQGYKLTPEKDEKMINFSYMRCKKKEKIDEENEYLNNIKYFEIPREVRKASFKDLYKDDTKRVEVLKYIKEFLKNYKDGKKIKGIYLNGSFGSGKTYLIAALFNDLAKKNYKSAIIFYPEFLRNLKSSFKTDYEEKFNYVKKVPLLLLDDIGAEAITVYSRDEVLSPILQYRMDEGLPTFFTSNLTIEELEKHLAVTSSGVDKVKARRIIERIKQLTVQIELVSQNRRI